MQNKKVSYRIRQLGLVLICRLRANYFNCKGLKSLFHQFFHVMQFLGANSFLICVAYTGVGVIKVRVGSTWSKSYRLLDFQERCALENEMHSCQMWRASSNIQP